MASSRWWEAMARRTPSGAPEPPLPPAAEGPFFLQMRLATHALGAGEPREGVAYLC